MGEPLSLISVEADTRHDDALVLRVGGEVDISTVGAIGRECTSLMAHRRPGQDCLIVDLEAVTFFGSSGLTALVDCQHAAEEEGMDFRVVADNPVVVRPLESTGLIRCFDWYPDVDTARAAAADRT
jgi:anti-anti-sigma factor